MLGKKNKFLILTILITGLIFFAIPVFSADPILSDVAVKSGFTASSASGAALSVNIGKIIQYTLGFTGTVFFVLAVYAGILWLTAQGNEESVGKAQKILTAATTGVVLAFSAFMITSFVIKGITARPNKQVSMVCLCKGVGIPIITTRVQSCSIMLVNDDENGRAEGLEACRSACSPSENVAGQDFDSFYEGTKCPE